MIVSIVSGKGGTGKTTVAVNLALVAEKSTYIDCDVEEPNGYIFLQPRLQEDKQVNIRVPQFGSQRCIACGKCVSRCRFHAIAQVKEKILFFSELCHGCGLCELVCPMDAVGWGERTIGHIQKGYSGKVLFAQGILNVGEKSGVSVIKRLKNEIVSDGFVVRDCPPGSSCSVMEAVEGSDFAVIVTEPTLFGVHDMQMVIELLRLRKISFGVVINKSIQQDHVIEEICKKENIPLISKIPFDREIALRYSEGETLRNSEHCRHFLYTYQRIKELAHR